MTFYELQKTPIGFKTIEEFKKLIEDMFEAKHKNCYKVYAESSCTPYGNKGLCYFYTIKITIPNLERFCFTYYFNTDDDNLEDMRNIIKEIYLGVDAYHQGYSAHMFACEHNRSAEL